MLLLALANVYQTGDASGSATVGLILVVTIAGILLGGRWAIIFAALSSLGIAFISFLQIQGRLVSNLEPNLLIDISLYILVTVLVGLLLQSTMTALYKALTQVESTNSQLRAISTSLEERVAARTLDISLAAEIGRRLSQQREIDQLLNETVSLIQSNFNLYHTQIYLIGADGKRLILRAATGLAGIELMQRNHHLAVGPGSINGIVASDKQPIVIPNVLENPLFRPNTLLPETRCELVVPLIVREQLIGTLNLQGNQINQMTLENLPAFET
jgi:putative methionine-R-sulfoxide reductase with GAF domain